ncbi:hypothetical protein KDA_15030 [Dictyobacter alpinus]|uniref:Uncharacterized protein n=1 Tax=Dictyobacter alpinus TaxID=2014873 RepID=A0A402B3U2_9CHLR|nr:hypothetical protein KDA_15030 [Dictyobacter alpinus]
MVLHGTFREGSFWALREATSLARGEWDRWETGPPRCGGWQTTVEGRNYGGLARGEGRDRWGRYPLLIIMAAKKCMNCK